MDDVARRSATVAVRLVAPITVVLKLQRPATRVNAGAGRWRGRPFRGVGGREDAVPIRSGAAPGDDAAGARASAA